MITYCPHSFTGAGHLRTCARLLQHMPKDEIESVLYVARVRRPGPASLEIHEAVPPWLRHTPWLLTRGIALPRVERAFMQAIAASDPDRTIVHFWPEPPARLVRYARSHGLMTVREMINCYRGTAKRIVDAAYREAGVAQATHITRAQVELEDQEFPHHSHFFASRQVVPTLLEAGVPQEKVLPTSFGWDPADLTPRGTEELGERVMGVFVGTVSIRKGAAQLLEAWAASGVEEPLWMVGSVEPALRALVRRYEGHPFIRFVGHATDVGRIYRAAQFLVIPTFEEGGPQVTYEAAGCGLPTITTVMGAGHMTEDGVTGLVVPSGDVGALTRAIKTMVASPELRHRMGEAARVRAESYTYEAISRRRATMLREALEDWRTRRSAQDG
ncbi:MAG TPA: glycosyltransferase family 4 protein [Caulobacteraceae bacterium]|nr:glycosyltransferase family 4 protein [Caulobacteraceae bacterium]